METGRENLKCIPFASAILERGKEAGREILIQVRWKSKTSPKYTGMFEIPGGAINSYENVFESLRREVFEETGVKITKIKSESKLVGSRNDEIQHFRPLCCVQTTKGDAPFMGFVFVCETDGAKPRPQDSETKDPRWVSVAELRKMVSETPEKFFIIHLGALREYLGIKA